MQNIFLKYVDQGRIRSLDDLKSCYRQIVMKTHPDAVGSDRLVECYIEYGRQYCEAMALISGGETSHGEQATMMSSDYRLLFYKEFYQLERIDRPYPFNKHYHCRQEIREVRERVDSYFLKWNKENADLHTRAHEEYERIKGEKPRGPYRKHALLCNVSPIFHNILSYQLTGLPFYRKQLEQNFDAVMYKLEMRGFEALTEYIRFLIADLDVGPAIMGSE